MLHDVDIYYLYKTLACIFTCSLCN